MPEVNSEREIKLLAPADLQLPALAGDVPGVASMAEGEPLDLSATYLDSTDFLLMRHGITLRRRFGEGSGPKWTLKLPVNGDDTLRSELNFPGDTSNPPREATGYLTGVLGGSKLARVARIKTRRRRWLLRDYRGADLAELVDDRVSILEGSFIKGTFREIEVEAISIDHQHLKEIANAIERAGARPEQRSKASRALAVLHPRALTSQALPAVSPDEPAAHAVAPALTRGLRYLLQHDPHTRLNEVEGVHGMRVGARRLRSAIRTFQPMLDPAKVTPVIGELRWIGSLLGNVRDLDVLIENLEAEAQAHPALKPVPELMNDSRRTFQSELATALSSTRYLELIATVRALIADEALVTSSPGTCADVMPELVMTDWRKLRKAARALTPDSPEADFHRVRILAKRARYAADTVSMFTKPSTKGQLQDFARALSVVQTVLGEHQDGAVAMDRLIAIATEFEGNSALALELGQLIERERQRAQRKRDEFFGVWQQLDKEKESPVVEAVDNPDTILAAGGVLWRPAAGSTDEVEIAVIHRPRYNDWSIPKGKLNPGEIAIEGAVREVNEETGYRATIIRPLGRVQYQKDGRPKVVRYWSMRAEGGVFIPGREVDELRWMPASQAMELLTMPRDRELLSRFTEGPATTRTVLLVRHGSAGSRSGYSGHDSERPLDSNGRRQADALIWLLTRWDVREVFSAPPVRCKQTVEPLASSVGLSVQETPLLSELDYYGREKRALALLRGLGPAATVICSQGGVIPDLLELLATEDGCALPDPLPARKGSVWSLTFDGERLYDAEYFPPLS